MADLSINVSPALAGTVGYGDLVMANGDFVLTADSDPSGTNPVLQDILFRLRTFAGEWFMDAGLGVPWYQQLVGVVGNSPTLDGILQNVVLSTPGVYKLTAWSSSMLRATRLLSISFSVLTAGGQVSYQSAVALDAAQGGAS